MASSDHGSSSGRYIDPDHVYALVIRRPPGDLFDYLESVPGARADLQCHLVSFAGRALLAPRPRSLPWSSWAAYWAKYAWAHAVMSSLCAPQVAGNPFSYSSDPVLRHAAMINQLDASSSSTSTAMLPPQQTNYNAVINYPFIPARTLDRTSASNLGGHASDFSPWGTDSTLELAFAKLSLGQPGSEQMAPWELMQNNQGTPAMGLPYLRQPGSEQMASWELMQNNQGTPAMGLPSLRQSRSAQLTPWELMQNNQSTAATGLPSLRQPPWELMQNREVNIKGKGPASVVEEQTVVVNVATLMAKDDTPGAAGLLIKSGTRQFICASYFPMPVTEPVLFAAACCEGIKIARAYQPRSIVLESHLFHLLKPYLDGGHAPCPQMKELVKLLDRTCPTVITQECNLVACQLALDCLATGMAEIFFGAAPDWLGLT